MEQGRINALGTSGSDGHIGASGTSGGDDATKSSDGWHDGSTWRRQRPQGTPSRSDLGPSRLALASCYKQLGQQVGMAMKALPRNGNAMGRGLCSTGGTVGGVAAAAAGVGFHTHLGSKVLMGSQSRATGYMSRAERGHGRRACGDWRRFFRFFSISI